MACSVSSYFLLSKPFKSFLVLREVQNAVLLWQTHQLLNNIYGLPKIKYKRKTNQHIGRYHEVSIIAIIFLRHCYLALAIRAAQTQSKLLPSSRTTQKITSCHILACDGVLVC